MSLSLDTDVLPKQKLISLTTYLSVGYAAISK